MIYVRNSKTGKTHILVEFKDGMKATLCGRGLGDHYRTGIRSYEISPIGNMPFDMCTVCLSIERTYAYD